MEEVPEEAIQEVEGEPEVTAHDHDGITGEDGTLRRHIQGVHRLEVSPHMSPSTQSGLHDRLHEERGAADD